MRILLLACSLLFVSTSFAQATDPLQAELTKLAADAESLQKDLPSFTCKETAISQRITKGQVKWQVKFATDLYVRRLPSGTLDEHVECTEADGKPVTDCHFKIPVMVQGGFDETLIYFLPRVQPCLKFMLSKNRIDFDSPPDAFKNSSCKFIASPTGFALLDDAGNVTHIEHHVPEKYARQVHVTTFTSIDLATTELNGKFYPLATKGAVELPDHSDTLRFETAYTGCHLFKAHVTLLPGSAPVTEDNTPQPTPHP